MDAQCIAKGWSKPKVHVIEVVGVYGTYQKSIKIGGPNSYHFREKWTWVISSKKTSKV